MADEAEPRVRKLLAAYPRMPATVIAERIGWSYSIRTLSGRVRELRPLYLPPDPASRTTYVAGEIAQYDFGFPTLWFRWATARSAPPRRCRCRPWCGYSRWASAVLIPTRSAEDLYAGWLFGAVASVPTMWRSPNEIDQQGIAVVALVRNQVRKRVWESIEASNGAIPASRTCYRDLGQVIVIRIGASLIGSHSDKQCAAGNFIRLSPAAGVV